MSRAPEDATRGALWSLADHGLVALVVLDPEGTVVEANAPAAALGFSTGRAPGFAGPEDGHPHRRAARGPARVELDVRLPAGARRLTFRGAPHPRGTVHLVDAVGVPEEAERLRLAIESAEVGTWEWVVPTSELRWSDTTFRLFGVAPGAFVPSFEGYVGLLHPEDADAVTGRIAASLDGSIPSFSIQHRACLPDGSVRWMECRGQVHRGADGAALRMLGTILDVTERKQAELSARSNRARLSILLRNTPNLALQGYDLDGRVQFWNPASEAMFGFPEAEAVGRTLDELIQTPEEFCAFRELLQRVAATGEATPPTEYPFRRRDGTTGWCLSTLFLLSGPDEPPVVVCMDVDRSESRRLEERMAQSERLESLGRLAGGVAHDFNNLLTSILGFADLAGEAARPGSSQLAHLRQVRDAAERGASLTRQLLAYARRQVVNPRRVDVGLLLARVSTLLPRVLPDHVEVVVHTAHDVPPVRIDPVQFDQIVLNLAINAGDAMPGGGVVTLATGRRVVDGPHPEVPAGEWVVLSVVDEGPGIPAEVRPRLFEPFFTTKPLGKGTGLGLATCYGIVRQSGGYLTVRSEPGAGACFEVWLPPSPGPLDPATADPTPTGTLGHQTVLLVEDDPNIQDLGAAILRKRGYVVLVAGNGAEALALARDFPGRIDLLFSDVVMPRMGGRELALALTAERPDTAVLLTSGHTADAAELPAGVRFLPKPFRPGDLAAAVRDALGAGPAPRGPARP